MTLHKLGCYALLKEVSTWLWLKSEYTVVSVVSLKKQDTKSFTFDNFWHPVSESWLRLW